MCASELIQGCGPIVVDVESLVGAARLRPYFALK